MAKYINWAETVDRYKVVQTRGSDEDVTSAYIDYAEADIEARLAPAYTAPFSDNNMTVKDLCIDNTLYKILAYKDTKKAESILKSIESRIEKLLDGTMQMVTTSGDLLSQSVATAWSETDGYAPTFGAGDITDFIVSSERLYDEENARD